MRFTRRTLIGGALGAATASILVGCSDDPGTTNNADGNAAGTMRFSIWFGEGDIEVWKNVIDGFQKENPDITVKFEPQEYDNFWTKLNTQLAGGSAPDVLGMQFQGATLGPSGQLAPLDDAMAANASKIPEFLTKVGQATQDGTTTQYALPWRFVGSALYGNTTELEKAGISIPESGWSLDDFVAAAKELTQGSSFGLLVPQWSMQVPIASGFGAAPVSEDGATATYNTPEMLALKTFLRDLIHVHKVAPVPNKVSEQKDPFATGLVRMQFQGSWQIPVYRNIDQFEWDILPNPAGQQQPPMNYAGPDQISIYAKSENQAAAMKFVEYAVYNRDAQEILGATGLPVLKDYLLDEERIAAEVELGPANYDYFVEQATEHGQGWAFVPQFAEITKLEVDADYSIMSKPDSDIQGTLAALNSKVQAALDGTR